jgi:ribosomal protein S20
MTPSPANATGMLRDWSNGDREAPDQLFRAVYNELHRQAARNLRHENPGLSCRRQI